MARRDLNLDEEKRSYAGLWLLSAALLLVGAIWALLDDSFFRRPWKAYQRAFFSTEETRAKDDLAKEEAKLQGHVEAWQASISPSFSARNVMNSISAVFDDLGNLNTGNVGPG